METTSSLVACIGTGVSGICIGAQLKRWYKETDIVLFDRHAELGGTWWINSYPGCACDVPTPLYSLSFEQNPEWSSLFPPAREFKNYLDRVAAKYDLTRKMRFNSEVKNCTWDDKAKEWTLEIEDVKTGKKHKHISKIVFACSGLLVRPRELDVPGSETFKGPIFHSARWRHDVNFRNKKTILFGNGCTAAQIVPNLMREQQPAKLTQITRTKHWILPAPELNYTPVLYAILKYVPGALALLRFMSFLLGEISFPFFYTNAFANWYRKRATASARAYMQKKSPPELHDALIPNFELGCKRRIFDPGYLKSLYDPRISLETRKVKQIVPDGVEMEDGTKVEADIIVTANGFKTNYYMDGLNVTGTNGQTLAEHWAKFPGPEAYNTTSLSGFPNFFVILGPNTATGHTSAIMASENAICYALRLIKPILQRRATTVDVKPEAEQKYVADMQRALSKRVWATGCGSWYVQDNNWNASTYPWSQLHFWLRSVFPVWRDLIVK